MLQLADLEMLSNKQGSRSGGDNTGVSLGMENRIGGPRVGRDWKRKFCMKFCLLEMSEAMSVKSHEPDYLTMSQTRTTLSF